MSEGRITGEEHQEEMVYYGNAHKYTINKGCYWGYRRPRNTQIPKRDPPKLHVHKVDRHKMQRTPRGGDVGSAAHWAIALGLAPAISLKVQHSVGLRDAVLQL